MSNQVRTVTLSEAEGSTVDLDSVVKNLSSVPGLVVKTWKKKGPHANKKPKAVEATVESK